METLKGLDLLNTGKQPLSDASRNYYLNTFAGGTSTNGTYVICDFMGTAIGVTVGTYLDQATTIINNQSSNLSTLSNIYGRMVKSCDGTYGPAPAGPIVIPVGPGAGTYTDPDSAVVALIGLAQTEIGNLVTTLGSDTTTLNNAWNSICSRVVYEVNNLQKCNVNLNALLPGDQFSSLAFVGSLPEYGTDTTEGGAAQFMQSIANQTSQSGQAIVGALREGRNNVKMDAARVGRDNTVPDNPTSEPPQANVAAPSYTVAEARDFVNQINRAV